jgi:hypothetical protein
MVLPFLAAAAPLFAAGANVIGGAMASSAQRHANETNLKSVRETNRSNRHSVWATNKANKEIAAKNNAMALAIYEGQRADQKSAIQIAAEDARKAGINPLTAIRGGHAYQGPQAPVLTSPTMQAALDSAPQITANTHLGEAVANAGATLYSAFANQPDPEREYLEKALLAQELNDRQSEALPVWHRDWGFSIPSTVQTTGGNGGQSTSDYYSDVHPDGYTGYRVFGNDVDPSPSATDAERLGDRYGDFIEDIGGFGVLFQDIYRNVVPKGAPLRGQDSPATPPARPPRDRAGEIMRGGRVIEPPDPWMYRGKAPGWR